MPIARIVLTMLSLFIALGTAVAQNTPTTFVAHLDGSQEVPLRDTPAVGQAIFQLNAAGTELRYRLIASNIENVVAAHIHLGVAGANGPVVAFLFGSVPPAGGRTDGVL